MIDMTRYWPTVLAIGIGTLAIRYSFILIIDKIALPNTVQKMLRFIPASVLPALVVPAVVLQKSGAEMGFSGLERPVAALVAALVAWKTRNILATIASGMIALWGVQVLL